MQGPRFNSWFGKIPERREGLLTPVFWPREFHRVHGVSKSQTWLSNFHFQYKWVIAALKCANICLMHGLILDLILLIHFIVLIAKKQLGVLQFNQCPPVTLSGIIHIRCPLPWLLTLAAYRTEANHLFYEHLLMRMYICNSELGYRWIKCDWFKF